MKRITSKVVGRLTRYRAFLSEHFPKDRTHVFSHEIASAMGIAASQVRRDFMGLGFFGVPSHGYEVAALVAHIGSLLSQDRSHSVAVVGVGNLGRAIVAFLDSRRAALRIAAAFDDDPERVGRRFGGVLCHSLENMDEILRREGIQVAVLCVPAGAAQGVADRLVWAGIKGILNFAPAPLRVPPGVVLEELDVTSALEKVIYFATNSNRAHKEKHHVVPEER